MKGKAYHETMSDGVSFSGVSKQTICVPVQIQHTGRTGQRHSQNHPAEKKVYTPDEVELLDRHFDEE